jgi:uncharacterized protein YjiS (DUF1127 family)
MMTYGRFLDWRDLRLGLSEWRRNIRLRAELTNLDDRMLRDIGLSRGQARFESSKISWAP